MRAANARPLFGWLVLWLLLRPGPARAEIAIEDSLEWLCAQAQRVVTGRVKAVQAVDPSRAGPDAAGAQKAPGKSRDLVLFLVQVSQTLKGAPLPAEVCIGSRTLRADGLQQQAAQGVELIFFLDETAQATSYQGRVCNLWPLRTSDGVAALIPLAAPGRRALQASTFQVLGDRAAIVSACQKTVARLAQRPGPLEQGLLEVPFGTPVHGALYGGSACYLNVPRALFPAAKASLR